MSYVAISQGIALILNVAALAILAGILSPTDFGIAGVGMIFFNLLYYVQDFGVQSAIIQRDSRIDDSISSGLALRLMFSCILFAAIALSTPLISDFFEEPETSLVIIVMTLNLFILAVGFPAQITVTRALRFSRIAIAGVAQYVLFALVSVFLALLGFSYWSIVLGTLTGSAAFVAVLVNYERRFFKPKWDPGLIRELVGFGKHLFVISLMAFVIFNVDQVIVAKVIGVAMLGIYVLAVRFGRSLGDQVTGAVNRVLFPTMARIKDEPQRLRTGYLQSLRMISIVVAPLTMGISAVSPFFVDVILGPNWDEAIAPIAILAFQGLFNSLTAPAMNVLTSIGKPRIMSMQAVAQAVLIAIGAYPAAVLFGVNGVCALTTIVSAGVVVYYILVFSRLFNSAPSEVASPMIRPIASGIIMFALVWAVSLTLSTNVVSLLILVGLGVIAYFSALYYLSNGNDVRDLRNLIRGTISR